MLLHTPHPPPNLAHQPVCDAEYEHHTVKSTLQRALRDVTTNRLFPNWSDPVCETLGTRPPLSSDYSQLTVERSPARMGYAVYS